MVAMVAPSGSEQPEPTGWALVRTLVREFVHELRHPMPRTLRYLRCDGCGEVTTHSSDTRVITVEQHGMIASRSEAVCDLCGHAQPRVVGDEFPVEGDGEVCRAPAPPATVRAQPPPVRALVRRAVRRVECAVPMVFHPPAPDR